MVMRLKEDTLFNPDWTSSLDKAATASDGCSNWRGEGFLCQIEFPEHVLVRDWIPNSAAVMEFGARYGTTTCELAKKVGNSGRVIAVEPAITAWNDLEANLLAHHCHAHVVRGVVGKRP